MAWTDAARAVAAASRRNQKLASAGQAHIKKARAEATRIFGSGNQNPVVVAKRKKYIRQAANQLSMASIRRMGRSSY